MNDKPSILYVDDEKINLQLFTINMRKNYKVLIAEDGMKGLALLRDKPDIHVVISDMKMPKMSGIEFIKEAAARFPEIGYFILTGYEITDEIQEALQSGLIIQYFRKPFDITEIDNAIRNVVG